MLVKSDATSTQVDLNATFLYNNMVWLGVSYRTEDAIAPMIGYQFKPNDKSMLRIGYSYNVATSALSNYSSGSHEVMLNYCVLLVKPPDVADLPQRKVPLTEQNQNASTAVHRLVQGVHLPEYPENIGPCKENQWNGITGRA